MNATQLRYARFGDPAEVLELIEATPRPPGSGEVSLAVEASPIHMGDLMNISGREGLKPDSLPRVPGIEGLGRVVALGSGVEDLAPGDRVLFRCASHVGASAGYDDGAWQSHVTVPAARTYPAPEGDPRQLAHLVNVLTAEVFLSDVACTKPGEWVLQNGANSNVGRYLVCLANRAGVRTVNVVRRAGVVPELEALGADSVILDGPDLAARVTQATGGDPVHVALDCVGGDATARLASCLADGGTVFNYGLMSGDSCHVPGRELIYRNLRLAGYFMAPPFNAHSPAEQRTIIDRLAAQLADGTLPAKIAGAYDLENYRAAVAHAAESGDNRDGKVLFVLPSQDGGKETG